MTQDRSERQKFELKSTQFREERQARWVELEILVDQIERRGVRRLLADDLRRLPALYRSAISSLSVARSISLDRGLLTYLEALAARSYVVVYSARQRLWDVARDFVLHDYPEEVRRHWRELAVAAGLLALGTACGYAMTLDAPERFYSFVSEPMAGGRGPAQTCEALRAPLFSTGTADELAYFASYLFSHNAGIGIAAFGLGFAAGVPTALLLFTNGLTLGAFAAIYQPCGLGRSLWLWLLPHGVTELLAICLCGAAGLVIARGLLLPGPYSRLDSLALAGRRAGVIALGTVGLFFIAGLIEGFYRQLVADELSRLVMILSTALLWAAYFGFVGRERGNSP